MADRDEVPLRDRERDRDVRGEFAETAAETAHATDLAARRGPNSVVLVDGEARRLPVARGARMLDEREVNPDTRRPDPDTLVTALADYGSGARPDEEAVPLDERDPIEGRGPDYDDGLVGVLSERDEHREKRLTDRDPDEYGDRSDRPDRRSTDRDRR